MSVSVSGGLPAAAPEEMRIPCVTLMASALKSSLNGIEVKSSTHLSSWMFGAGMLMPNHAEWKKNGPAYSLAYFTTCMFVCLRWQTALQLVQQQRKESGSYLWQAVFLMFCCSVNTSRTVYDSSPEEVFCYMLIVVIF